MINLIFAMFELAIGILLFAVVGTALCALLVAVAVLIKAWMEG